DTDIYKTTAKADLREGPSEPTTINYQQWVAGNTYSVGSKVTYNSHNYKCTYFDQSSGQIMVPPNNSSWWTEIARRTSGSPVISTLNTGTELYLLEDVDTNWYKMSTTYGLIGYIKKSQVTYDRHISPSDLQPRVITEQLFRIKEVSVDRKSGTVSVSGNHVSNDLNGVLVKEVNVTNVVPAMAIGKITEAFMESYRGNIATNITDDTYGKYTGQIKRKNGMFCLTDPDTGIVPTFDARFTRDNWDLFIMEKTATSAVCRIQYGKNADGIQWNVKTNGLILRVIPVAKAENGEDLYLPENYIDSAYIGNYPVTYMEPLNVKGQVGKDDGSGTDTNWTEETLLDEMRAKAQARFDVDKVDIPVTDVTVQLEQLENTAEYAWMKGLREVVLYDYIDAEDPDIGLDITLTVSEIEFDCIKEKIVGIKLSNNIYGERNTVAGYNIVNGALTENKLAGGVKDNIIQDAVSQVLAILD
ncbi:MAG: phage tail protein, partial [Lachnospiraceae bacterium]|nr:phage tail protein [Lachnospiraceae bacterium]